MQRISRIYFASLEVLWAAALIGLPLTTFPLFASRMSAVVAPFSAGPILLILALWLLPTLVLRKKRLPIEAWPLLVFVIVALLSSAAAFFVEVPTLKGKSLFDQELRAFITLGIGLGFYLVCASWPQDIPRLRKSLQWIHIGGALMVLWALSQVIYIITQAESYPAWLLNIQRYLVIKPSHFFFRGERTSGLAYEASWFAHQLATLYLPLWLSATFQRKSVFNFRLLGLSFENILLVAGLAEFMMSSPRVSLLSLMLMLVLLIVFFNVWLVRKITRFITSRQQRTPSRLLRFGLPLGISIILLAGYILIFLGAIYFISQRDSRLELLVNKPPSWQEIKGLLRLDEITIIIVAARLAFLERVIYWLTGWRIFNDFPWLGVGLGNAGFFFTLKVPSVGWSSYEIRNVINVLPGLPNIKSFWVRLLAESGIVGFYVFAGWYYLMGKSSRLLRHSLDPTNKIIALAGLLSLVAFLSEGFSIDSFAMPYLWVITGLLSAASMAYRNNLKLEKQEVGLK